MILRPYRRIRQLEAEVATAHRVRDALYEVLHDERRADLATAVGVMGQMHERLKLQAEELESLDRALRLLAESRRRLGVGA